MSMKIHRWPVPVDDKWHRWTGCSKPLFVACRDPRIVEFWAWDQPGLGTIEFRVYATGQPIDVPCAYVDTAISPDGQFVWHLMSRS